MTRVAVLYNDDAAALSIGEAKDRLAVAAAATEAGAIAAALAARGHAVASVPVRSDLLGFVAALRASAAEVVFNACEGFGGEARLEGAVAAVLEISGLPFTGNGAAALYLAQDKERAKAALRGAGLPVARGAVLARADDPLPAGLAYPLFVKTRFEDASHGISTENVCAREAALRERARALIAAYRQDVLVEEFLPGRELNVAVLDALPDPSGGEASPAAPPTVLPISEIDYSKLEPGKPAVVTYDAKWVEDSPDYRGTPVVCPAPLEGALREEVERLSRAAYAAIGCRGYARVDLRFDRDGRPVILEANPNPDISPEAGFARSAARAGIDHEELIDRIVRIALVHAPTRRRL